MHELRRWPVHRRYGRQLRAQDTVARTALRNFECRFDVLDRHDRLEPQGRIFLVRHVRSRDPAPALVYPVELPDLELERLRFQQLRDGFVIAKHRLVGDERREEFERLLALALVACGMLSCALQREQVALSDTADENGESDRCHQPRNQTPFGPDALKTE